MKKFAFLFIGVIIIGQLCHAQQILMPYRKGNLWGYADTTGKIVVAPQFDRTDLFVDNFNYASVRKFAGDKNYLGLVKNTGQVIIMPTQFRSYELASRSISLVKHLSPPTYLPTRLKSDPDKKPYAKTPHWTDSLPIFFFAKKGDGYKARDSVYLFDSTGKQLTFTPAEQITAFSYQPLQYSFLVTQNGKHGVIDQTGKKVIPAEYDWLECVNEANGHYVVIAQKNKQYGLIDLKNKIILPLKYYEIRKEEYGGWNNKQFLLIVNNNKDEAVFDENGKMVDDFKPGTVSIETAYDGKNKYIIKRGSNTERGLEIIVEQDQAKAVIGIISPEAMSNDYNRNGNTRSSTAEIYIDKGLSGVKKGDSILIPAQYKSLMQINTINKKAIYQAGNNDKKGVVDQYNTMLIPLKYKSIESILYDYNTNDMLFRATDNDGKWGIISLKNKTLVPFKYNSITYTSSGTNIIIACSNDASTLFYNNAGTLLFKTDFISARPAYLRIDSLSQQLWIVSNKVNQFGAINNSGHIVFEPIYKNITLQDNNGFTSQGQFIYCITFEDKTGLYSRDGKKLLPPVYDTIYIFKNNGSRTKSDINTYFVGGKNGLFGITDMYGTVKLPYEYDNYFNFLNTQFPYILIKKGDQYGLASFDFPDLVVPQKNIEFNSADNNVEKLTRGIIFYRNTTAGKNNNLGAFITKNGKVIQQVPGRYKYDWGGRSSSVSKKYFLFLAMEYNKGNQRFYDYIGYNGVLFYEDE